MIKENLDPGTEVAFSDLMGETINSIYSTLEDKLIIVLENKGTFVLKHDQDCCESVTLDEIWGDLDDLVGTPILQAEESSFKSDTEEDSHTWTFYKLATIKGYVTLKWFGQSNGYYSETVELYKA